MEYSYEDTPINPKCLTACYTKLLKYSFTGVNSNFNNFESLDIQPIAKNVFDTEYYHTSNSSVERYRQPQRTILLKLTYNL